MFLRKMKIVNIEPCYHVTISNNEKECFTGFFKCFAIEMLKEYKYYRGQGCFCCNYLGKNHPNLPDLSVDY